jgi:hypothetical protein
MPTIKGDQASKELFAAAQKVAALSREHFGYNDRVRIADAMNLLVRHIGVIEMTTTFHVAD